MSNVLTLLPARLLDLGRLSVSHESVVRLELLHRLARVVDEREAGALATTILRPETEARDLVLARLVQFAELAAELILGDVGAVGVEDIAVRALLLAVHHIWHRRAGGCGGFSRGVVVMVVAVSGVKDLLRTQPSACGPGAGCG